MATSKKRHLRGLVAEAPEPGRLEDKTGFCRALFPFIRLAMPTLDLISPDDALRHAIPEQLTAPNAWQVIEALPLVAALEAWKSRTPEAIFLDDGALDQHAPQLVKAVQARTPPALLFLLGESPSTVDEKSVSERFPKPLRLGYLLTRLHFFTASRITTNEMPSMP